MADGIACPLDMPRGVLARPGCLLQGVTTNATTDGRVPHHCALQCHSTADCGTAVGASCVGLGKISICTYGVDDDAE